jgi:hypothetical protein
MLMLNSVIERERDRGKHFKEFVFVLGNGCEAISVFISVNNTNHKQKSDKGEEEPNVEEERAEPWSLQNLGQIERIQ